MSIKTAMLEPLRNAFLITLPLKVNSDQNMSWWLDAHREGREGKEEGKEGGRE